MTIHAPSSTAESAPLKTAVSLIVGVFFPIAYCVVLLFAKGIALSDALAEPGFRTTRGTLEIVHLSLSMLFVVLLGLLFVIRKKPVGPRATWSGIIVALAGSLFPFLLAVGDTAGASDGVLLTSTVILIIGEGLTIWALMSLGRCFGVFPAARGLVTSGPYAWVRHPLYTAEAIVVLGFLITRINWLTITIFVAGIALQAWRTINEERVLSQVFPEYQAYRARTGRFLPWIG